MTYDRKTVTVLGAARKILMTISGDSSELTPETIAHILDAHHFADEKTIDAELDAKKIVTKNQELIPEDIGVIPRP